MDATRKCNGKGPLNGTSWAIWCSLVGLVGSAWVIDDWRKDPAAFYVGAIFGAVIGYSAAKFINRVFAADLIKRIELSRNPRGPLSWLADRSWRFWVATIIMLPVLYVGSFGPVCWIMSRDTTSGPRPTFLKRGEPNPFRNAYRPGPFIYKPLYYFVGHDRGPLGNALRSYVFHGIARAKNPGEAIVPWLRDDGIWWGRTSPKEINAISSQQTVSDDAP